ncbi:hypothetical protein GCM10009642_19980 [Nocardiopsis metallicus]
MRGFDAVVRAGGLRRAGGAAELEVDLRGAVTEQEQPEDHPGNDEDVEQSRGFHPFGNGAAEESADSPQGTGVFRFAAVGSTTRAVPSPTHAAPYTASRR